MIKKISNQKGSVLIYVLVVTVVLSILGVTVLNIATAETKQVVFQENQIKSFYAARSGADAVASYLIENIDELNTFIIHNESDRIVDRLLMKIDGPAFSAEAREFGPNLLSESLEPGATVVFSNLENAAWTVSIRYNDPSITMPYKTTTKRFTLLGNETYNWWWYN